MAGNPRWCVAVLLLFAVGRVPDPARADAAADDRPNILLIIADDLGYADLGVHGSDIRTPNIDTLAGEGMLCTQFHTAPMCAPTRAMMLSGNNNHVAGMGRQGPKRILRENLPGYEGHLSDRIAPLPRLLAAAGYHTYSVGKWHLGMALEHGPKAVGFERSFNLIDGAANHFDSVGFFAGGSTFRADGKDIDFPAGGYSTEVYTDQLIGFIGAGAGDGRPFFAYASYTSPHWPLQVPDEYLDLYRGRYDAGYDALREDRFASLKKAGIIPASSSLPPRNEAITPWDELDLEQKRREARKMELYAAMVENLDHHVGRLIGYLKENGLYDNTLIVFMSDNGPAGEDFYNRSSYREYIRAHYDNAYENMGRATSWVSYGEPWAEAGSPAFSRFKRYTREGGIRAPFIVAGPRVSAHGVIDDTYFTVMDLAPTFLELAEARYPDDGSVRPMLGESLLPLLADGAPVHDEDYVTVLYHGGRALVRQGRWKLVNLDPPFDESAFELFDLETDPGETVNLAEAEPEKRAELLALWRAERKRLGIVLPGDL
ncbi:MAG: arylsulfatase [Candidatus Krumholzibacteriota bacterium]